MSNTKKVTKQSPLIAGAGLVVLDIIIENDAQVPLFSAGGTCGNVLAGLSYLGWESTAISRSGVDLAGDLMTKNLSACGVNINYIKREKKVQTPRIIEKLYTKDMHSKHSFLLQCPKCNTYLPQFRSPRLDDVENILRENRNPQVFFFDRISPAILEFARYYRDAGALIYFEPNRITNLNDLEKAISLCHVLKYSGRETESYMTNEERKIMNSYNIDLIIKTVGKSGLFFKYSKTDKWHHQKSITLKEITDSCGAGDWCTVGFLFSLYALTNQKKIDFTNGLKSYDLIKSSLKFAQTLSALSCNFIGARGLSDAVEKNILINWINYYLNEKCNLKLVIDKVMNQHNLTPKIKQKFNKINACPICLM